MKGGDKYDRRRKKNVTCSLQKTWDYDPDDEEVDAKYDKEFNDWCDNFLNEKVK